jgi:phage terminase large subunit-like protein
MTSGPVALSIACGLVLEDGRPWGEAATPLQIDDMTALLDRAGPRYHFLTRPRGGSKTTDVGAALVTTLVLDAPPGSRSYAVAADGDQARLLHDAMRGLIERTPGIAGAFTVEARRITAVTSGASLEVIAADGPSTYGLRPYVAVMDELAVWPDTANSRQVFDALASAAPKLPDSRLVLITSAGSPTHWSYRIFEHACTSTQWRVSEMPGPCPWHWPEALAEQRALLSESQYARLFLNEWTEAEDHLTTHEDLRACVRFTGVQPARRRCRYVMGLDMGYVDDRAVLAVCHRDPDGSVSLDNMRVWAGSRRSPVREADVEHEVLDFWSNYRRAPLWLDPWQTKGLAQRLRTRRVRVEEYAFSAQSVGRLALTLYRLLRDHTLALPDDPELLDELANVRLRESAPGVYRLDHKEGRHDDRAVALALCAQALLELPNRRRVRTASPTDERVTPDWLGLQRPTTAEIYAMPLREHIRYAQTWPR